MDKPKSLDSIFKDKLFRIPDYQRGFAWQVEHLKAFWEDLINLSNGRSHYTGLLTLKQIASNDIDESDKEFWLVDDHSYKMYHIVDGQQRLTTFIICIQAYLDLITDLPENKNTSDENIYISDSLSVVAVRDKYLFRIKPTGDKYRTYKFGYMVDNPSDRYLRYRIFDEDGGGTVSETFYTLNMNNARRYFTEQFKYLYQQEGMSGLQGVYKKLTKRLLFNEYIIKDEFDVFVAFETMNNRGKMLSHLELLKNRLIYLTTLYDEGELDVAERNSLRKTVNEAWKEVYYQLGRNKTMPLNDDDFLRAHWMMYYKYSRKTGQDYIRFLLEEQFTPQKIHQKTVHEVILEDPEEYPSDIEYETTEFDNDESENESVRENNNNSITKLEPTDIGDYVVSLKDSSVYWFNSFYPFMDNNISQKEQEWIDRLNRIGIFYFRPLVMAILKNEPKEQKRIEVFQQIERFIFIVFRLTTTRANYRSSEFYNAARAIDRHEITVEQITNKLKKRMSFTFNEDGTLRNNEFYNILLKKFDSGSGYYSWSGLRYFLYEYELSLLSKSVHKKVDWNDLLRSKKDKISIEHIYPQTETSVWAKDFQEINKEDKPKYAQSLGNLLLLSQSINSSLQNDSFIQKKQAKMNSEGVKLRNGYSDGSHSEIEVSEQNIWGPEQIRNRGLKLLKFMEKRWDFRFKNDHEREELLCPQLIEDDE